MEEYKLAISVIYSLFLVSLIITATIIINKIITRLIMSFEPLVHAQRPFRIDPTHFKFFKHFITGIIYFIGFSFAITMIPPLKTVAFSLLASSGIIAIIAGFASQQTFSNIISGLFLDVFRPFEIGDTIKVGTTYSGIVEDITLRHTVLKTDKNNFVMVPNATISNEIIENETWSDRKIRMSLDIYVDYKADIKKAINLITEILAADQRIIEPSDDEIHKPKVETKVNKLNLSNIHIKCWIWAPSSYIGEEIIYDAYLRIKEAFDANNIPFAHCSCSIDSPA